MEAKNSLQGGKNMKITIRQEVQQDQGAVYQLVKEAFATAPHRDGDEQDRVERLRRSRSFIPELSLVAEAEGRIVGYCLFTLAKVGKTPVLAVAPLAVLPVYQGKGVGSALIRRGHQIAKELGYGFTILLGHPSYYPRFGYLPASVFGTKAPFPVPEECFMVCNLLGGRPRLEGVVEYDPAFFAGPQA